MSKAKLSKIIINGKTLEVWDYILTFEEICQLAGVIFTEYMKPEITYVTKGYRAQKGILSPEQSLNIDGASEVIINVAHTNKA